MDDETQIIPRNVINKDDTFPIDIIAHFELEKRQIPYLAIGGGICALAFFNPTLPLILKFVCPTIGLGATTILSNFKVEGQPLEQICMNYLLYLKDENTINNKKDLKNGDKNIRSRISKFKIKKR